MFICQHVHFGGEKEREKMRERDKDGQTEEKPLNKNR